MSKTTAAAAVAATFKGAKTADKDANKSSVVVHVSYGKDKDEDFRLDRAQFAILQNGMQQAEKTDNYWQENARRIVAIFWPDAEVECEGMTAKEVKATLRGDSDDPESVKPYSRLFAALAQATEAYNRALKQEARMNTLVKGSEEYDGAKHAAAGLFEKARKLANQQGRAIIDHFANQIAGKDATSGDTRKDLTARMMIEATIADYTEALGQKRFEKLHAERALLGNAIHALRVVLADSLKAANPQNAIAPQITAPATGKAAAPALV